MLPRVLIYAGIDEAGYGPMLGPLCVACTVFSIRDLDGATCVGGSGACDLWKRLGKAVCRKKTDKKHRVVVDDSKALKGAADGPNHPLKHLERGVLSFLGDLPASCSDLFTTLGVAVDPHDWYATTSSLPVGQSTDELRIAASRLRKALDEQGIAIELMRCEAIDAHTFNQQVERMGNKANVNMCAALRMIDAVWQRFPQHHPTIVVDHHGGRTRYLQTLMQAYPEAHAQVLAEEESISAYRLTQRMGGADSTINVTFLVEAERAHLPVALASMTAKYVRELFMLRMNRHFRSFLPELKPTAGYTEDARRYLKDIEPLITGRGIDRTRLVRAV